MTEEVITPPRLGGTAFLQQSEEIARLDSQRASLRTTLVEPFLAYMKSAVDTLALTADELRSINLQYLVPARTSDREGPSTLIQYPSQGLSYGLPRNSRVVKTLTPKYQDALGNTWAGRGSKPAWVLEHIANGGTLETLLAGKSKTESALQASLLVESAANQEKPN